MSRCTMSTSVRAEAETEGLDGGIAEAADRQRRACRCAGVECMTANRRREVLT